MFNYIIGKISDIEGNNIILDNNGIGYSISVSNPYLFIIDKEYKIFVYNHIRENENSLYGFISKEEKELFLKLINIKGLGPKMALPLFSSGNIDGLKDAIERENILYLIKFPKIGEKLARQIILDLKGKLVLTEDTDKSNDELVLALESLGYKNNDIKNVIVKVNKTLPIEGQIKDALKLLLK